MIGETLAKTIVEERVRNGPFVDLPEVARRVRLTKPQVEALATAGAFGCFGESRRSALWAAGAVAGESLEKLPGLTTGAKAPMLPGMDEIDIAAADVWATGVSPDSFPTQFIRDHLDELGVVTAAGLRDVPHGTYVLTGGAVTHRQRPATAGGVTFVNLEDETGMINIICPMSVWQRYHRVARGSPALLVHGVVERTAEVVNVLAEQIRHLPLRITAKSRDFR